MHEDMLHFFLDSKFLFISVSVVDNTCLPCLEVFLLPFFNGCKIALKKAIDGGITYCNTPFRLTSKNHQRMCKGTRMLNK